MAATGSSNVGASRSGWVAFSDESVHTGKHGGMQAPGVSQPIADSSFGENCVAGPVVQQRSSWVQFDEKPWTPSPPSSASHSPHPLHPPSQVKERRARSIDRVISLTALTPSTALTNYPSVGCRRRQVAMATSINHSIC
ncbi:hypothetical protein C0J45_7348 [Silurus meridionalis]|nr:hypothetical protein C0J45_7348 [Silurus meridionalis]